MTETAIAASYRVVACAGGDRVRMEARPVLEPARGELLLRLRVVGLCGTDLFKLDGGRLSPGSVLGHELVGEVVAAGNAVSGFASGDRVAVPHHVACGECHLCRSGSDTMCPSFRENLLEPGGFSELILVRPRAVSHAARRIPDAVGDEAAVFLEPAACVLRGIRRAELSQDGVAAVLGGGSMGLLHLLLLKAAVPGVRVVVVDPVAERRQLAMSLGAVQSCPPGEAALARVRELSGGVGADAVFDTAGGAGALSAGLELSRAGGSLVIFAHAPEGERADFEINDLFKRERRVLGTYSGGLKEQAGVFEMLISGAFDPTPLVTHRLPLAQFDRGVALARAGQALKVLFTP